ncbi:hypothetical protein [Brevundimonas sp. FT23028]|uniref:hypothetical protein n=1 Tax=Brevundimonas sp. FT23028 TaxID=3393748 RepID=UPI003B5887B5
MAIPARLDLKARRNTPFSYEFTFSDDGDPQDFTGAVVAMQARLYGAQPGDPLIDLAEVFAPVTEGLIVEPGSVQVWIDEASLMTLPTGPAGSDVTLQYDLKVQLPGSVAEIWAAGTLTVSPGVTDRLTLLTNEGGAFLTNEDGAYLTGE